MWPARRRFEDLDRGRRTARLAEEGWVLPWGLARQVDHAAASFVPRLAGEGLVNRTGRRWTLVGPAGGPAAAVDPAGLVTPRLGGWSLDWWVGADDRWRLACREPGVRQALVESTPVTETRMRVPGGDAVHRCFGVPGFVVIEVENRSPSPFALALAIRPYDPLGATSIRTVAVEGSHVMVDGSTALVLAGPPGLAAASKASIGDVAHVVFGGGAGPAVERTSCSSGLASVAVLIPVAHRTTVRAVIPLDECQGHLDGLPSVEAAVRGWKAQSRTGMRIGVPDSQWQQAFDAARRSLLLVEGDEPGPADVVALVVAALARTGRHAEADELVRTLWSRQRTDGSFDQPAGDGALANRGSGSTAAELLGLACSDPGRGGHPAIVGPAGLDVMATAAVAAAEVAAGDPAGLERVTWLVRAGDPTWSWPDHVHPRTGAGSGGLGHSAAAAAAFVLVVRDLLVTERVPGHAVLLPVLPLAWRGQPVEVNDAVLYGGVRLSFAVRWHGHRPALLWEASGPLHLTAPGLDPTFATTQARGEALLAAAADESTVELS